MPSMKEIYERYAREYDELVSCEDHCGNLSVALEEVLPQGARVLELGAGTGRVTRLYADRVGEVICCDRSQHMLERAKASLRPYGDRIRFLVADNDRLPDLGGPYDAIIEGWSFGHSAVAHSDDLDGWFGALQERLLGLLAPGGTIVLVETLGTMVSEPAAPGPVLKEFYVLLEQGHGYARRVLDTSYRFPDRSEAERILGFFFGPELAAKVSSPIVPEFSGLWSCRKR